MSFVSKNGQVGQQVGPCDTSTQKRIHCCTCWPRGLDATGSWISVLSSQYVFLLSTPFSSEGLTGSLSILLLDVLLQSCLPFPFPKSNHIFHALFWEAHLTLSFPELPERSVLPATVWCVGLSSQCYGYPTPVFPWSGYSSSVFSGCFSINISHSTAVGVCVQLSHQFLEERIQTMLDTFSDMYDIAWHKSMFRKFGNLKELLSRKS